jgi:hypothetical protein
VIRHRKTVKKSALIRTAAFPIQDDNDNDAGESEDKEKCQIKNEGRQEKYQEPGDFFHLFFNHCVFFPDFPLFLGIYYNVLVNYFCLLSFLQVNILLY